MKSDAARTGAYAFDADFRRRRWLRFRHAATIRCTGLHYGFAGRIFAIRC